MGVWVCGCVGVWVFLFVIVFYVCLGLRLCLRLRLRLRLRPRLLAGWLAGSLARWLARFLACLLAGLLACLSVFVLVACSCSCLCWGVSLSLCLYVSVCVCVCVRVCVGYRVGFDLFSRGLPVATADRLATTPVPPSCRELCGSFGVCVRFERRPGKLGTIFRRASAARKRCKVVGCFQPFGVQSSAFFQLSFKQSVPGCYHQLWFIRRERPKPQ